MQGFLQSLDKVIAKSMRSGPDYISCFSAGIRRERKFIERIERISVQASSAHERSLLSSGHWAWLGRIDEYRDRLANEILNLDHDITLKLSADQLCVLPHHTCSATYLIAMKNACWILRRKTAWRQNEIADRSSQLDTLERVFVISSSARSAGTKPSRVTTPMEGRFL